MSRAVPRRRSPLRAAPRRLLRFAAGATAAAAAAFPGCAPGPPGDAGRPCPVLPGDVAEPRAPWTFALCAAVDPAHARSPRNDAEATVFRHAYEGLLHVDCDGKLVGDLATAWRTDDDGRTWILELAPDRAFDDGTPVTPLEILRSWRQGRPEGRTRAHRSWLWTDFLLRNAETDGNTLTIPLTGPDPDFPYRLAHAEFLVLREGADAWPVGTRGRVVRERAVEGGHELSFSPPAGTRNPVDDPVRFRVLPGTDPRDAFRDDTNALLTRDRRALRYLAAQPDVRLTPLPWTRRYALLDPAGAFAWIDADLPSLRGELARDVLPSVARVPWDPGPVVPGAADPDAAPGAFALRYVRDDPDGAAAAERVASLATRHESEKRWVVVAAPPASVFSGEAPAIVTLERFAFDPPPGRTHAVSLDMGGALYPLADTRAHLVTRDLAGVTFDWDGIPRLDRAGPAKEEAR